MEVRTNTWNIVSVCCVQWRKLETNKMFMLVSSGGSSDQENGRKQDGVWDETWGIRSVAWHQSGPNQSECIDVILRANSSLNLDKFEFVSVGLLLNKGFCFIFCPAEVGRSIAWCGLWHKTVQDSARWRRWGLCVCVPPCRCGYAFPYSLRCPHIVSNGWTSHLLFFAVVKIKEHQLMHDSCQPAKTEELHKIKEQTFQKKMKLSQRLETRNTEIEKKWFVAFHHDTCWFFCRFLKFRTWKTLCIWTGDKTCSRFTSRK